MPAKKKKGKASKLSRMSDEERLRYMQHRAEIELEAKRRKQQLIAAFSKSKLKREEAFSRLNTAKIHEQWRHILRQIKCKELHEDVSNLWQRFDCALKTKDAFIRQLYDELSIADRDHRRSQEAHIITVDKFIVLHKQRLNYLYENYKKELGDLKHIATIEYNDLKTKLEDSCKEQEIIIFAQNTSLEKNLKKTRTHNATLTQSVVHSKEDNIMALRNRVVTNMECLWSDLISTISDYETSSESKRKQYEYLKEQDDIIRAESALFPEQQTQLVETIESMKGQLDDLEWERGEQINELKNQQEQLNKAIFRLRSEIKMAQVIDAIQLKRLSVMCNGVTKDLERLVEKGSTLQFLTELCSNLEGSSGSTRRSPQEQNQATGNSSAHCDNEPFGKMEKFWQRFNEAKAENIFMKKEQAHLLAENKRLRHSLRIYLVTVARMPAAARPQIPLRKGRELAWSALTDEI